MKQGEWIFRPVCPAVSSLFRAYLPVIFSFFLMNRVRIGVLVGAREDRGHIASVFY